MRILGSGIGATTLKLINANTDSQYFAIGHRLNSGGGSPVPTPVDFAEVSDLTINCNLPATGSVRCGAIRLMGNHVKVHRVRAVNWGNSISPANPAKVCFVIAVLTADRSAGNFEAVNCGIDRCAADQPASNGAASPVTVLHVGGNEGATGVDKEGYGRACYIRNSFVDASQVSMSADVRALSMGWCRAGIVEGNQAHNVRVGGPYQDKATTREIVVRNNSYRNVIRGPYWKLGLNNAPAPIDLSSIALDLTDATHKTALATVTTGTHDYQVGERVKIDGTGGQSGYKGVFLISDTTSTTFKYVMESAQSSDYGGSQKSARKVFGVANILVERNIIELATGANTAELAVHVDDGKSDTIPDATVDTPDYVYTEAIVRENRVRYVDVRFEATWSGEGIRVSGAKNAIVRDNVVEVGPANPLKNFRCGTVKYFNNKNPAGALIKGYNGLTNQTYSELENESEDALVLTLI